MRNIGQTYEKSWPGCFIKDSMKLISNDQLLTFDDISLCPAEFSSLRSRSDVDTSQTISKTTLKLPILASNMTSVITPALVNKLQELGGKGILHRFNTIEENVQLFKDCSLNGKPWVSIGTSEFHMERAEALVEAGAEVVVIDQAMGNHITAVEQYNRLVDKYPNIDVIVGDFCLSSQINEFMSRVSKTPAAFLIGQGCGSACKTREVTGIGIPVMSAINSCNAAGNYNLILNGGIRNSGDMCKALAAGVKAVILGRLFSQCSESVEVDPKFNYFNPDLRQSNMRIYSGSASKESYASQEKTANFRAPEGESYSIKVDNTVENLFNSFSGGLKSSMSYLNSKNLDEFREKARFVKITNAGSKESSAFGKNL